MIKTKKALQYLEEKAKTAKRLLEIFSLAEEIREDFYCGNIVPATAVGIVCGKLASYLSTIMGLTAYEQDVALREIAKHFSNKTNKSGVKLIDYDEMLYPQYDYKFTTIPMSTTENLKEQAKNLLLQSEYANIDVKKRWEDIANGNIPFGLKPTRWEE